jgi:5-methylcytosine-specific restriction endonuclease McrA
MQISKKPRRWNRINLTIPLMIGITRRRALQIHRAGVDLSDESEIKKWLSTVKERLSVSLKASSRHRAERVCKVEKLRTSHTAGMTMRDACNAHAISYQSAKNLSREIGLRWGRLRKSVQPKSSPTIDNIRNIPKNLMLRKSTSVHPLCGISGVKLREWIESKFTKSMTWENYGKRWHLDHIFPISRFDLSDPEQVKVACNWQNLQPLLRKANARKSDKITKPQLPLALVTE